ncbi:hypothetical protein [Patulibacter sp.]|uniref:hypothetical protein n=1 Tax=Patulibacter sp. TaxID=1912859 RepID=UPI002721390A|nr:hypothetical protein [Patulibacter sp.]MDO9408518.1 hypothetical protein [Patulibacter sp.]
MPLALPSPSTGLRRSAPALLAASLLLAAPVGASAASSSKVPSGTAKVSRGVCATSATDLQARAASFSVTVRDLPPAGSYGFSARLEERMPGARWKALKGQDVPSGFGAFEVARSGAPSMSRRITVRGLHPGSSYRLRVTYRWTGSSSTTVVRRTSRACAVKDLRPDVGLTGEFGWQPSTTGGEVAYRIGLRSDGLDALKGVDVPVVVRQGQSVLATGVVRPSAASEVVLLTGRRCVQGSPVTVELDPDGLVEDRDATDDLLSASCLPVAR